MKAPGLSYKLVPPLAAVSVSRRRMHGEGSDPPQPPQQARRTSLDAQWFVERGSAYGGTQQQVAGGAAHLKRYARLKRSCEYPISLAGGGCIISIETRSHSAVNRPVCSGSLRPLDLALPCIGIAGGGGRPGLSSTSAAGACWPLTGRELLRAWRRGD